MRLRKKKMQRRHSRERCFENNSSNTLRIDKQQVHYDNCDVCTIKRLLQNMEEQEKWKKQSAHLKRGGVWEN